MKLKIFVVFLLVFFCGCHSATSPSPSPSRSILRVNFSEDPVTLDPRKGGDPTSCSFKFMLFEGLTRMAPSSSSELAIAKDIVISEDKRVYTFHLRHTLWSNGEPLKAHDFAYAWRTLLAPEFPSPDSALLFPIKNARAVKMGDLPGDALGVRVIDERTLEVELERPTPYFLHLTSFCIYFPIPQDRAFSPQVTNGPFKMERYRPSDLMVVEKNPLYWDAEHVEIDKVQITFIENEMTAFDLYMQQKLDCLGAGFSSIPVDVIPQLRKEGNLQVIPVGATSFCTFNLNASPFSNVNIRKAFAYSMDREAIVNYITQTGEEAAFGPVPPLLKEGRITQFFPGQDLLKAQNYLQAGLAELNLTKDDLQGVPFTYLIGGIHGRVVQALQHQWMNILGVWVKLEGYTSKVYLDKLMKRDYTFGYGLWIVQYPDLMNILDRFKFKSNAKNYPGWENARYVDILDASTTISSPLEYTLLLEEAEKLLIDEMVIAPIYHWKEGFIHHPHVSDIYISPIGSIHLGFAKISKEEIYEN